MKTPEIAFKLLEKEGIRLERNRRRKAGRILPAYAMRPHVLVKKDGVWKLQIPDYGPLKQKKGSQ